ncbi:MAG: hypothetical protein WCH75_09215, partial [Candidatus Binatia bacterium]
KHLPPRHGGPSAAEPQPKTRNISRKGAKAAKVGELRVKIVDENFYLSLEKLSDFAPWRDECPTPSTSTYKSFAQDAQILSYSSAKFAEIGAFIHQKSFTSAHSASRL